MKLKIGVIAEPFGYGPSSKAFVIVKCLREQVDCSIYLNTETVTEDFFNKEEIPYETIDMNGNYDLLINVLSPQHIKTFVDRNIPIVYVDSLGFMWNESLFKTFPELNEVNAYLVQDVFGSHQHLSEIMERPEVLVPVGAIIDNRSGNAIDGCYDNVFQLGGMYNPINTKPIENYYNLVRNILADFEDDNSLMISSSMAKSRFEKHFDFKSMVHSEAIWHLSNAKKIFTSPGLTTLLELGSMNKEFAVLPPQNMSQLIILRKLASCCESPSALLDYILSFYPKQSFSNEEEGVNYVVEVNRTLAQRDDFIKNCIQLVRSESIHFPQNQSYDGVNQCTQIIMDLINENGQGDFVSKAWECNQE